MEPEPPWAAWDPWEATARLGGVDAPWYVASGWALDVFHGAPTREHADLEIAVPAGRFGAVKAALAGYEFGVVGSGHRWPLDSPAFDVMHQTWVREPDNGPYRMDVFREPHDGDVWIYRREHSIRMPYEQIILTSPDGVPYLTPEIVLLFNAKHGRPKDEADFAGVLPLLDPAQRGWLAEKLAQVHPRHRWLEQP
ncbi:MAG: hypothetical protein L0Y54_21980 [Sporichthyaceae bacterium]|nr:hypothetical protein [Sporichthyaceae bacterium]